MFGRVQYLPPCPVHSLFHTLTHSLSLSLSLQLSEYHVLLSLFSEDRVKTSRGMTEGVVKRLDDIKQYLQSLQLVSEHVQYIQVVYSLYTCVCTCK